MSRLVVVLILSGIIAVGRSREIQNSTSSDTNSNGPYFDYLIDTVMSIVTKGEENAMLVVSNIINVISLPHEKLMKFGLDVLQNIETVVFSMASKLSVQAGNMIEIGDDFLNKAKTCFDQNGSDVLKSTLLGGAGCVANKAHSIVTIMGQGANNLKDLRVVLSNLMNITNCKDWKCAMKKFADTGDLSMNLAMNSIKTGVSGIFLVSTMGARLPSCVGAQLAITPPIEIAKIGRNFGQCMADNYKNQNN